MYQIQQITADPLQKQILTLPDGSQINLTIEFKPLQYGWFIRDLIYGFFILHGMRICVSPNILHQFKNILPFGIACFSNNNNREPTQQFDFSSNAANLFVLTSNEVKQYLDILNG